MRARSNTQALIDQAIALSLADMPEPSQPPCNMESTPDRELIDQAIALSLAEMERPSSARPDPPPPPQFPPPPVPPPGPPAAATTTPDVPPQQVVSVTCGPGRLGIHLTDRNGQTIIHSIDEGSLASQLPLVAGAVLISCNGESLAGLDHQTAGVIIGSAARPLNLTVGLPEFERERRA